MWTNLKARLSAAQYKIWTWSKQFFFWVNEEFYRVLLFGLALSVMAIIPLRIVAQREIEEAHRAEYRRMQELVNSAVRDAIQDEFHKRDRDEFNKRER